MRFASARAGTLLGPGLAASLLAAAVALGAASRVHRPADNRPIEVTHDGYVSSRSCRGCHPAQYASWHASYHRTMTQVASPEAVVGDFSGQELEIYGERHRLERRGDRFVVTQRLADGSGPQEREVVLTTGSHHFQAYWVESGEARKVQLLQFAWSIRDGRWVPFDTVPLAPPLPEFRQVTAVAGRWNWTCINCHTTAPQPRVLEPAGYDTRVGELGIACEACHGPAEEHVRTNRNPLKRYWLHLSGEPDPTITNPNRLSPVRASEICAQCHAARAEDDDPHALAAWSANGSAYRPGQVLDDTRAVSLSDGEQTLTSNSMTAFWLDGTPRVNSREFVGLLRSPCFQRGELSCMSCHSMHQTTDDPRPAREWADDQLEPGMRGNRACLQCHPAFEPVDALTAHTHHAESSAGSDCMNCHMPHTAWGLQKASRNHQIDVPRLSDTLATGRPHACNQCHLDRTLEWTAGWMQRWYGLAPPALGPEDHELAAGVRWIVEGDAGQRALAAWSMGWPEARTASDWRWMVPLLALELYDEYPINRAVALAALRTLPGYGDVRVDFVGPAPERSRTVRELIQRFRQQGGAPGRNDPASLLLTPAGDPDLARYNELRARRNTRLLYLLE